MGLRPHPPLPLTHDKTLKIKSLAIDPRRTALCINLFTLSVNKRTVEAHLILGKSRMNVLNQQFALTSLANYLRVIRRVYRPQLRYLVYPFDNRLLQTARSRGSMVHNHLV